MSRKIVRIDPTMLKKVSTYARDEKKSDTWVYNKIALKELKSVKIDGVVFVHKGMTEVISIENTLKANNVTFEIMIEDEIDATLIERMENQIHLNNEIIELLSREV